MPWDLDFENSIRTGSAAALRTSTRSTIIFASLSAPEGNNCPRNRWTSAISSPVVARPRAGCVPKDHGVLGGRHGQYPTAEARIVVDREVDLPVVGLLDDHLGLFHFGQSDDQIFDGRPVVPLGFGDVAFAPLFEAEMGQFAFQDFGRRRGLTTSMR